MDFQAFKNSHFFKLGLSRFSVYARQTWPESFCMYDSSPIHALSSADPYLDEYILPSHRRITPLHLKEALGIRKQTENEVDFIPAEFRDVIVKQYIEVTDICEKILQDRNKDITDPNKKLRFTTAKLLITEPGMPVPQHIHNCKQTITMVYRFDEDKLEIDADPAHFLMGKFFQHKVYLPEGDKVIFTMTDDPPHYVHSPDWRFWWFNDFNDYVDIPPNLPFVYWEDEFLHNKALA